MTVRFTDLKPRRSTLEKIPLRADPFLGWGPKVHFTLLVLFLLLFAVLWLNLWTGFPRFGVARWPDGLLLVLTAATTLAALCRQLPAQNVMLASALVMFVAGLVHTVGALSGVPFGPYIYQKPLGQTLFDPLPWSIPVIWLVAVLNARGVGRLILRPWRKTRNYGFWLMGLTVLLVILFDLAFEPFATEVKGFWTWNRTRAGLFWYTTPWINFIGWGVTALLMLLFVTPSLINKKPVKHPPDYHPLLIWALLNLFFVTGMAAHHLWLGVATVSAVSVAIAVAAIRGASW